MLEKIFKIFVKVISIIILVIFLSIGFSILFLDNNIFSKINYSKIILFFSFFLIFLLLFYLLFYLKKQKKISNRVKIIIYFLILFVFQIILLNFLKVQPSWDFGTVYESALKFATENAFHDMDYFRMYPNNLFSFFILSFFFKLFHIFGVTDFITLGGILNIVFIDISIFITYLIIKKKFNLESAKISLLFFALLTPIFIGGAIFYSDTLSMPFVVGIIYVLECIHSKTYNTSKKIIYFILTSLFLFVAIKLKFTAVIIFISIFINYLLKLDKTALKKILYLTVLMLFINLSYNKVVLTSLYKNSDVKSVPYTHWIMMGLNKETYGIFNEKDYLSTNQKQTTDEKISFNISTSKNRLKEFGFSGYLNFLKNKNFKTWSDGTYFFPEKLRRKPIEKNDIHEYVLSNGSKFDLYFNFSQTIHLINILLIAFLAFKQIKSNKINFEFIPLLALFGLLVFLLIWETRSRYLVNYIPIIVMCSSIALNSILKEGSDFLNARKNKTTIR